MKKIEAVGTPTDAAAMFRAALTKRLAHIPPFPAISMPGGPVTCKGSGSAKTS